MTQISKLNFVLGGDRNYQSLEGGGGAQVRNTRPPVELGEQSRGEERRGGKTIPIVIQVFQCPVGVW